MGDRQGAQGGKHSVGDDQQHVAAGREARRGLDESLDEGRAICQENLHRAVC